MNAQECEEKESSPAQLVKAAREAMDGEEKSTEAQRNSKEALADIAKRPPSLVAAVDSALRVRVERERSYRRPSRRPEYEDILLPGAISTPRPPLVEIFVDRSGSFNPEKTREAEKKLADLMVRYRAKIRWDVWFFGSDRLSATDIPGGGNTPYELVAAHICRSVPRLAVIITDDDSVQEGISRPPKATSVICVPVGCSRTLLASALGGMDTTR